MILGLFIRNFKTYQGLKFIPLTNQYNFCGLLGKNGIGKSSVLEALDCFFNNKEWNLNFSVKRNGSKARVYIVPIFAIEKSSIEPELKDRFDRLDTLFRNNSTSLNFGGSDRTVKSIFNDFKSSIVNNIYFDDKYIIPVGVDSDKKLTASLFDSVITANYSNETDLDKDDKEDLDKEDLDKEYSDEKYILIKEQLEPCLKYIQKAFEYIYIPKDMDSDLFTRLENQEIQILMGEKLDDILKDRITATAIDSINKGLNDFINEINNELDGYVYRTITERQQNLKKSDIHKLIIDAFFNIRKLHKKQDGNYIEINALSSGEKQKAIIDVARGLLENHRTNGGNLIIAIDEPESSLHISACFEQFDSLFKMSSQCRQLIFSSHWYGFLPVLSEGNICIISETKGHHFDLINMNNYREQIEHMVQSSNGKLPYDINLKSITDFIQSILASIISENPYNWILCEGSSEKVYFDYYFEQQIRENKLRIIPTGGAKKIKRIYQNLLTPYQEIKDTIDNNTYQKWGKILFLSDTDVQVLDYEIKKYDSLWCKRLLNEDKSNKTVLVHIDDNLKSPATEIEDCLNGRLFVETLKFFSSMERYNYLTEIIEDKEYSENSSFFVMDLRNSERAKLHEFFDSNNGKMKIDFANKYVELAKLNSYTEPEWISEIKEWINAQ